MSLQDLMLLQEARAYDPVPARKHLHELHVPFDDLLGHRRWESSLDASVRRGERVAVIGASGDGKSSLIEFCLGPLVEGLAPLTVPVAMTSDSSSVADPAGFASHLVKVVHRYLDLALPKQAGKAPARLSGRTARSHGFTVAPQWLEARVELGYELQTVTNHGQASGVDDLQTAQQLLDLVRAADLCPVLVLDDTDKWTEAGDNETRDGFFNRTVRLLGEDMGCAAVVAVHPTYLGDAAYQNAARGFLSSALTVPRLPDAQALASVLDHRTSLGLGQGGRSVWTQDGIGVLYALYSAAGAGTSLRNALYLAHTALTIACSTGDDNIARAHIDLARRENNPTH